MKQISNYQGETNHLSAFPPPVWLVNYFNALKNNRQWLEFIVNNCIGPRMPLKPGAFCPNTVPPIYDKFCNCCKGKWSIVIGYLDPAGYITAYLVAITEINKTGNVYSVYGHIYPDLQNVHRINASVAHIGCYY